MIKCSFCEQPLVCQACSRPFRPTSPEAHAAVYQSDMAVSCPECKSDLICKECGYNYAENEEEEADTV